jgi:hypothetical protein
VYRQDLPIHQPHAPVRPGRPQGRILPLGAPPTPTEVSSFPIDDVRGVGAWPCARPRTTMVDQRCMLLGAGRAGPRLVDQRDAVAGTRGSGRRGTVGGAPPPRITFSCQRRRIGTPAPFKGEHATALGPGAVDRAPVLAENNIAAAHGVNAAATFLWPSGDSSELDG